MVRGRGGVGRVVSEGTRQCRPEKVNPKGLHLCGIGEAIVHAG